MTRQRSDSGTTASYRGFVFRTALDARWAAFFDLAGWTWQYMPIDLRGWSPTFRVDFPCRHSECSGGHTLFVAVEPYRSLSDFKDHPCMDYPFGCRYPDDEPAAEIATRDRDARIPADASAAFGNHPDVTHWEMAHGSGGGGESVADWIVPQTPADDLWAEAGRRVQTSTAGQPGLL